MSSFESVSTWRQPTPSAASPERTRLVHAVAVAVTELSPGRLRVAVDGASAAGKTSFGHELAAAVRSLGRPTLRASLDDFKNPWREARERGYDRITGEGYYRNAPDFSSARELLLRPAGREGSGRVVLCGHDPLTGADRRDHVVPAAPDAVLIVDGMFAFRAEYDEFWDYRIYLEVDPQTALERGVDRDTESEGNAELALRLHRDRYQVAEAIYRAEVDPHTRADLVIDNSRFSRPEIVR